LNCGGSEGKTGLMERRPSKIYEVSEGGGRLISGGREAVEPGLIGDLRNGEIGRDTLKSRP